MSSKNTHPDLTEDFFSEIDTLQKAYWLGFLYADGFVSKSGNRTSLILSAKDTDQVDRFASAIGANPDGKRFYGPYGATKKQVHFTVTNRDFTQNLVRHGCLYKKTFKIRWPFSSLRTGGVELAFLMGFFDGDGSEDSTDITCGSFQFLEDISQRYGLGEVVSVTDTTHRLNLGKELFLKMIENYRDSMPRKRRLHRESLLWDSQMKAISPKTCLDCSAPICHSSTRCGPCDAKRRLFSTEGEKIEWPEIDQIVKDLKESSFVKVASKYGVSDNAIRKRLRKRGIDPKSLK